MDPNRQKLIERASELNTSHFSVEELKERISEVCSEYVIEAKVDVDRLLRHEDFGVRLAALNIVWLGLGATDGLSQSIEILMHDPDEDVRADAALALYEAARGTPNEVRVRDAFKTVSESAETPDFVHDAAQAYLHKFDDKSSS